MPTGTMTASVRGFGTLWARLVAVIFGACLALVPARADVSYPLRPSGVECIVDTLGLLTPEDAAAIRAISSASLRDRRAPIVVCTIASRKTFGADAWTIERYARNLFDEWGVGDKTDSLGVLVLIAKDDRQVNITTGRGFHSALDARCKSIIDTTMTPAFKRGDYSAGLAAGVRTLDVVVRDHLTPSTAPPAAQAPPAASPAPPPTTVTMPSTVAPVSSRPVVSGFGAIFLVAAVFIIGSLILVLFLAVRAIARTASGRAPAGALGSYSTTGASRARADVGPDMLSTGMVAGSMMSMMSDHRRRSHADTSAGSSGADFGSSSSDSGGSCGGGSSDGGGASGSW